MSINPKTLELRNLLPGQRVEGVSHCGVCGKPHATLTKAAKDLPLHKQAITEDWAGHFRNLTKTLGGNIMLDLVARKKWNAQLDWYTDMLTKAREEHDAMPVSAQAAAGAARKAANQGAKAEQAEWGSKTVDLLSKSLLKLGVKVCGPSSDPKSIHMMAEMLNQELDALMAIKAEAEQIKSGQ